MDFMFSSPETRYIDLDDMSLLVREVGLERLLGLVVEALQEDFLRWNDFDKSPRTANHCPLGVVELMPVSDQHRFSFKYVNGHPKNHLRGLSTVMAFGALAEMETGWPLLLSEMTILTAIRTAAASVLAAKALARPGSLSMAMIGNGAQSEFQILGFHHLAGVQSFRLFDIDRHATEKLLKNLQGKACVTLIPCSSAAEAVRGADLVTTCTADKTRAIILNPDMVEPGMHLNAIGGDCPGKTELHPSILESSRVFVEYAPQSRIEGEVQAMPADFPVTELWEVLAGLAPGRQSASDVTVFDSVGFALEDYSALRVVHREAVARGIGKRLNLMPVMEDVKDVFGLLHPRVPART
jgi:ornithine cyclodeaminase